MNDDHIERGLWDLTACCRFYQTGACEHTEAGYDDAMRELHRDTDLEDMETDR